MNHIAGDNTAEWDARVQRERERGEKVRRRARIGITAGVVLGLLGLCLTLVVQPTVEPAVAAPPPSRAPAGHPGHLGIPLEVPIASETPGPEVLDQQAQSLAVGLARIWRSGKSGEAARSAHSYTVEYERMVGCDLRWIAGRAGPGVWKGTLSLVRSLHEFTPHVGRAREGQAVVVTAIICPS